MSFILFIIFAILIFDYVWGVFLEKLNMRNWNDTIPPEMKEFTDDEKYKNAKEYHKVNNRLSTLVETISLPIMLFVLYFGVLGKLDLFLRGHITNEILLGLVFFAIIGFISDVIKSPLEWYHTFVIEEKYGFNKMTKKLFFIDKIKGWILSGLLGGTLIGAVMWIHQRFGTEFWIWAWVTVSSFILLLSMFYSDLIVPLFNKQSPLEEGELKTAISDFAQKVGFKLKDIYVIYGSKRSTKANAYFTGFGPKKRIVLYDTLINDHSVKELVAVLAHEIGHYKKKHVIYTTVLSLMQSAFVFFLLSLVLKHPSVSEAVGVSPELAQKGVFHIQILIFGILISPMFEVIGIFTNSLSRKFEYQADAFAAKYGMGTDLISALKKMSVKHLSNLAPHSLYVIVHYSHPPLMQRIKGIFSVKNIK